MFKKIALIVSLLFIFNNAFATEWYHLQWLKGPGWHHKHMPRSGCLVKECFNRFGHVHCKYYNKCK